MAREEYLHRIADIVGPSVLEIQDAGNGWPGIAHVKVDEGLVPCALHVGPVGLSHRNRDDVERRFQNPGQDRPVEAPAGMAPLLIGLWEEGNRPVLVGMEAARRLGRGTRLSFFIPLWLLEKADKSGWAEHFSTSDERIIGFHPALLPIYVEMLRQEATVSAELLASVLEASGLTEEAPEPPEVRARRSAQVLVRDAKFRDNVVDAYGGLCAMCGLNLGLLEAAHIYPASAPNSPDEVWNGLALCRNHHAVLDRHLVWIDPDSRELRLHSELLGNVFRSESSRHFVESTYGRLAEPESPIFRPHSELIKKRYEFFADMYAWVSD